MMEVMSLFELDQTIISLRLRETISFQMFGEEYLMSFMNFSMRMGLVDVEYVRTELYPQLHVDLLVQPSPD